MRLSDRLISTWIITHIRQRGNNSIASTNAATQHFWQTATQEMVQTAAT